jgi:hypothetical protein
MKNKEKKESEWLIESPVGPDAARTRAILDTIPDEVVPGWKAKPEDKDEVFDRALLIAHSRPRAKSQTAERLLREAEVEVGEKRLEARAAEADASPELAAGQREAWKKYLAENSVPVQKAIKLITRREKWDDAKSWWERFWATKVKREGKPKEWLEAKLIQYRNPKKKLTLAEVEKLRQEFDQLSGYRGQGKVLRPTDGRTKVNRAKKLTKLQKAQEPKRPRGRPQTSVSIKPVFTGKLETLQSIAAAAATGKIPLRKPAY